MTQLTELGYTLHTEEKDIPHNKIKVDVTNRACGHRYHVKLLNLLNQSSKCAVCGPKKRMEYAMTHWMAKNARTYDLKEFEDYAYKVRSLSNKLYEANIDLLNPERKVRTRADMHEESVNLDHKIPIIECFKRGWTVGEAGGLDNIQIMDARENLKKSKKVLVDV